MVVIGCTRKGPPDTVVQSRAEDAGTPRTACHALESDAGTVNERFAEILPENSGGSVVYVFQGDLTKVTDLMAQEKLVYTRVAYCPNGTLIVFILGVDEELADGFEKEVAERDGGTTIVRERHILPPIILPLPPHRHSPSPP
jgi:hypothetical protein